MLATDQERPDVTERYELATQSKRLWSRTGSAAVGACSFPGRCFVVGVTLGAASPKLRRCKSATVTDDPQEANGTSRFDSDRPPQSAVSGPKRRPIDRTSSRPNVVGALQESDAAHDPSGAALCRDRSEPANRPIMRLAHDTSAGSTQAASAPHQGGEVMDYAFAYLEDTEAGLAPAPEPEPVAAAPQVPPPVWDSRPVDPLKCAAATKALCG
jgi:hypothetical protein